MTLRRPVLREHVTPLIALAVGQDQRGLVAENAVTLAQAAYEPGAEVWGLWEGGTPVGLMAMIDPREGALDPGDDPEAAYLWRLMIGAAHQGRGLGAAALAEACAQARLWGLPRLAATVVEREGSALPFYLRHGFRRTGRVTGGEAEIVLDLAPGS